jgi:ectoine hydroxylase-related dioxygenase (phytanoyl-CoA dioxygenase family)
MKPEAGSQKSESNDFSRFKQDGYQIIGSLVSASECDRFVAELSPLFEQRIKSAKGRTGGVRNLLQTSPIVSSFANSSTIAEILRGALGREAFPVRAIFFDKTPEANWLVPWHQDLMIAVAGQIETPGFTGWSVKEGMLHVHPPENILAGMITLRLHQDDCGANNGALKIIAGSHRSGKIPMIKVAGWASASEQIVCVIPRGGALLMRPLLLHASSPADSPCHRRVLHIEYATQKLPNGLEWFDN